MSRKNWTPEKEQFLKDNYQRMLDRELAEVLGLHKYIVQNRLRKLCLKRDRIWSKERIIEEIQKLGIKGESLSATNIKRIHSQLYDAANKKSYFGRWGKAVEAAGYTYSQHCRIQRYVDIKKKRSPYTLESIQKTIRQLYAKGKDLSYAGMKGSKYASMVNAASRMFNGWPNALASVGIDYSLVAKKRRPWTKKEIISTIRELIAKEIDVSFVGLKGSKYMGMVQMARKKEFWGSWGRAIDEAGYDYALIRKNRNTESERGLALQRVFEEVVKVLGLSLEPQIKGFKFDDDLCIPDFVDIASSCWIDIKISSMSGGIDSTVKKYLKYVDELWIYYLLGPDREWPDKRVHFKSIKDFFPKLKQIHREDLIEKFNKIAKSDADSIVFDTWAKKWDKNTVLSTIRERYKKGLPVTSNAIQDKQIGLYKAAMRYYKKSWPSFLEAAGINYDEVNDFEEWTPERVKADILSLYNAGKDLSHTGIHRTYPKLLWAATRHFKKWKFAVEACGIDYKQFLRQEQWTKERVLKELKKLIGKGADLSYTGMYQSNPKLVVAAERHLDSLQNALELLGVDYSKIRWQKKWTPELVIREIANLIVSSKNISSSYAQKHYNALYKAARRYYNNSWIKAVELAKLHFNKDDILQSTSST